MASFKRFVIPAGRFTRGGVVPEPTDPSENPYHPMSFANLIINGQHLQGEVLSLDEINDVLTNIGRDLSRPDPRDAARAVERAVLKKLCRLATRMAPPMPDAPPAPPRPPTEANPIIEAVKSVATTPSPNTLNMQGYDAQGNARFMSTQSCFDLDAAHRVISAALLLDDAGRRGVGVNDYPVGNIFITTKPVEQS